MTITAPTITTPVLDCLKIVTGYADVLTKDIPADKFAHQPHPGVNHPAFCFGHLSLYPDRVLGFIDRGDLVAERAGFAELFQAGVECVDQDGRYPAKDEIMEHYVERHRVVADAVAETSAEILAGPTPVEGRFKEMCPTVASAVNFMLVGHQMTHLGQVSAWRRMLGMPSAY